MSRKIALLGVTLLCCFLSPRAALAQAVAPAKLTAEQVAKAVAETDKLIIKSLHDTGMPGMAVAIVYKDRVVFEKGYGVRRVGEPDLIDTDTVFQIASVSKCFGSSIVAAMVGEGIVEWDDRVIDHDPGFELYNAASTRELRIRDLLCHRSSLPDHAGDLLEDIGYSRAEILHRLRYQPPDSSFRSKYAYTNFGYTEGCLAAAKASGKTWEDLAQQKIYGPLGMTSTSSRYDDYIKRPNRTYLHVKVNGKYVPKYVRQPDAQSPAGGVSSSIHDLTCWMRMQLGHGKFEGRQIVAADALAETHSPQIVVNFNAAQNRLVSYGLGWNVNFERGGQRFLKHSGAFFLGVRSEVALLPDEELGIIVLSNSGPNGMPEGIVESFFDLLIDGKLQRDWVAFANMMFQKEVDAETGGEFDYSHAPSDKTAPLPAGAYVATYKNDFYGPIEIVDSGRSLNLLLGPKKMSFPLQHWNRDVFLYQPIGENAGGLSSVRFTMNPEGKAQSVLVENLNIHGQGTFDRVVSEKAK